MSRVSGRRGCLTAVFLVVGTLVVSAFIPKLLDLIDDAHPAASAPPDLCAALGQDVFVRWVPDAVPETTTNYSAGSDAACDFRTDPAHPHGGDIYGSMHVRLLRYGQIGWKSASSLASEALASSCDNTAIAGRLHRVDGVADEACAAYSDEGTGGTAYGSVVLRRGADLIWVDYYTHPGSRDHAERAVTEVVSASLSRIA